MALTKAQKLALAETKNSDKNTVKNLDFGANFSVPKGIREKPAEEIVEKVEMAPLDPIKSEPPAKAEASTVVARKTKESKPVYNITMREKNTGKAKGNIKKKRVKISDNTVESQYLLFKKRMQLEIGDTFAKSPAELENVMGITRRRIQQFLTAWHQNEYIKVIEKFNAAEHKPNTYKIVY